MYIYKDMLALLLCMEKDVKPTTCSLFVVSIRFEKVREGADLIILNSDLIIFDSLENPSKQFSVS